MGYMRFLVQMYVICSEILTLYLYHIHFPENFFFIVLLCTSTSMFTIICVLCDVHLIFRLYMSVVKKFKICTCMILNSSLKFCGTLVNFFFSKSYDTLVQSFKVFHIYSRNFLFNFVFY